MREQLALANARDWCTVAWAAEHLNVSVRTVRRMIGDNVLNGYQPRVGSREAKRSHIVLYVEQVTEIKHARDRLQRSTNA